MTGLSKKTIILMALALSSLAAGPSQAQEVLQAQQVPPTGTIGNTGGTALPPPAAPAAPAAAQTGMFPPLPPAQPCSQGEIVGVWKLRYVFESPEGRDTLQFRRQPEQHVFFRNNRTFGLSIRKDPISVADVRKEINRAGANELKQFIVNDDGFIFFYTNSVAIDTKACFIVAEPTGMFRQGQMLLMPPQGQSATRVVHVYDKVWTPGQNRRNNNPAAR